MASHIKWSVSSSDNIKISAAKSSTTTILQNPLALIVDTEVKKGCILSPVLFSFPIHWLMCCVTRVSRQGLQWTQPQRIQTLPTTQDYYLSLQDLQGRIIYLNKTANIIGLRDNAKKTSPKEHRIINNNPVTISGTSLMGQRKDHNLDREKAGIVHKCLKFIIKIFWYNTIFNTNRKIHLG